MLDYAAAAFGAEGLALPASLESMMRDFWDLTCRLAYGKPVASLVTEA